MKPRIYSVLVGISLLSGMQCMSVASKLLEEASAKKIPSSATRVYGQLGSFTQNTANNGGVSANSLNTPVGVFADSSGVYIADHFNSRTLFYSGTSTTASRVYGQNATFTTNSANNPSIGATSLNKPRHVTIAGGGLYTSEDSNSRALFYSGTSLAASRVYGQFDVFTCGIQNNTSSGCVGTSVSANSMSSAFGVAADSAGVYVADSNNNRVLYYSGTSTTATTVYGQVGFGTATSGVSATQLNGPRGLALDSTGLYVADAANNRVLFFATGSTTATRVYGQNGNFTTNTSNNGGVSANSLSSPSAIALSTDGVYICDTNNHRILYYPGTSTTATRVWGQNDVMSNGSVNSGAASGANAAGFNQPLAVYFYDDTMYVSDTLNHRILAFVAQ